MDETTRYGIYRVVPGSDEPQQIAFCGLDDIGCAIKTLAEDGEFDIDGCTVGVLDGFKGTWYISPFRGRYYKWSADRY